MTDTRPDQPSPLGSRTRYAVVGTGHRAQMYVDALCGPHEDVGRIVAWCEPNPERVAYYDELVARHAPEWAAGPDGVAPQAYAPEDLERMIAEQHVDRVIVTTPDALHADVVVRALRAGADVVLEKPMTTSVEGCRAISAALAETGRDLVLTFNYRYSPRNSALRRVIASGEIGEVTAVHLEWVLDTVHGADYFRRWHRDREVSGGLLVHKASHHFDLVNWWVGDEPVSVTAHGRRRFYGPENAPSADRPVRGTPGAPDGPDAGAPGDPFLLDLTDDPRLAALYLGAEQHDGYRRDQDPFAPGATIDDTMAVLVGYRRGAMLSYSLTAYGPWEGYRVSVTGTRGRAELEVVERAAVELRDGSRPVVDPSAVEDLATDAVRRRGDRLVVQQHWGPAREVEIPAGAGAHGGGDAEMLRDLFRGVRVDPLGRAARFVDGVAATAVGLAANVSVARGSSVRVRDLALDRPPSLAAAGERTPEAAR
ncbi:oxidoreductase family protein [Sediminihabitans luteus]|uniref:Oxidoreductase family protein n=1 Tax=Sediminihabitans luteus TaxID=1138585 RepID=A0A2M9CZP5_9CELL|nr:Gfo/Idh/MocA family oxidoreductase [Sediminihabitans luteus]PJJ77411.1 oxidoreductase family protein [Sediminihabitans luteus]GII98304.1 dehydrogenase [Sediminihabitans luteus]